MKTQKTQAERIYEWHKKQKVKNNASTARLFRCSREWVRLVIKRERDKEHANLLARAQQIAEENQNAIDTLVER